MVGFDSQVLKVIFWTVLNQASKSLWQDISQTSACMDHNLGSCHLPERAFTMVILGEALESLMDSDTGPHSDFC